MGACAIQSVREACRFRQEFGNLDLDGQAAMLRNCVEVLGPALRECEAKRQLLGDWITAQ